jgi:hypothetical protein
MGNHKKWLMICKENFNMMQSFLKLKNHRNLNENNNSVRMNLTSANSSLLNNINYILLSPTKFNVSQRSKTTNSTKNLKKIGLEIKNKA